MKVLAVFTVFLAAAASYTLTHIVTNTWIVPDEFVAKQLINEEENGNTISNLTSEFTNNNNLAKALLDFYSKDSAKLLQASEELNVTPPTAPKPEPGNYQDYKEDARTLKANKMPLRNVFPASSVGPTEVMRTEDGPVIPHARFFLTAHKITNNN